MKVRVPSLLFLLMMAVTRVDAATPADTLVVAGSLEGIISLDPAESFETVSSGNLVNLYQQLVASDRQHPDKLDPDAAASWQPGPDGHSLIFTLKPGQKLVLDYSKGEGPLRFGGCNLCIFLPGSHSTSQSPACIL